MIQTLTKHPIIQRPNYKKPCRNRRCDRVLIYNASHMVIRLQSTGKITAALYGKTTGDFYLNCPQCKTCTGITTAESERAFKAYNA